VINAILLLLSQEEELIKKLYSADNLVRETASAELVKVAKDINERLIQEVKNTDRDDVKLILQQIIVARDKNALGDIKCEGKEKLLDLITTWDTVELYKAVIRVKDFKLDTEDLVKVYRYILKKEIATSKEKGVVIYAAPPAMVDDVAQFLKDKEPSLRGAAISKLTDLKAKQYASAIVSFLTDSNDEVRRRAVYSLRSFGLAEHKTEIVKLLKDDSARVVQEALWALDEFKATEYSKDVAALLAHREHLIRSFSASLLSRWDRKELSPEIAKLLSDSVHIVRGNAAVSLARLEAKQFVYDIAKLLEDVEGFVRRMACQALAMLNAKGSSGAIARLLVDKEESVRLEACMTLAQFGDKLCLETIAEFALRDKSSYTTEALYAVNYFYSASMCQNLKKIQIKGKPPSNELKQVLSWLGEQSKVEFQIEVDLASLRLEDSSDRNLDAAMERVLKHILYAVDHNIALIFTDNKIRVVSTKIAKEFFDDWRKKNR
jgi:HEAT repeat protein